jgi:aldose sugar dehydrogenase
MNKLQLRRAGVGLLAAGFSLLLSAPGQAESLMGTYGSGETRFRLVVVAGDLSYPWGMAFLPQGGILVTERTGSLRLIEGDRATVIKGLPNVAAEGQGGLLDIALHPGFASNRLVYFSYGARYGRGAGTRIGRGRLEASTITDFEVIFSMDNPTRSTHHFGSRLAFAPDGTLFFTVGERGDRARAQELGDHAGKVHRINDDGSIPSDNPYLNTRGAQPSVYSLGHRNQQGLAVDPVTGTVWAHEHGPKGGDEVNIIRPGLNYGWPTITYGMEYSGAYIAPSTRPGLEQPVIHWTPSIAPSGLMVYRSDMFPGWDGNLFAGALAGQHLRRLIVDDDQVIGQEILLKETVGRIRDVRQGPDGNVWLLTDAASGKLFRIEPAH